MQCAAWRGELGQEPSPELFIAHLVDVFREVKRVLRPDGTLWCNIGDSYAGSWGARGRGAGTNAPRPDWEEKHGTTAPNRKVAGCKPKDLVGIPWMLAFALRADGWYLRSEIIWSKPNVMPESVRDRPTKAHEQVFLLTKNERYFFDNEAIKERGPGKPPGNKGSHKYADPDLIDGGDYRRGRSLAAIGASESHNKRTVWAISSTPFKGAHFATMPARLAATCIKAGSSRHGCCPACGAQWRRVVKKRRIATRPGNDSKVHGAASVHPDSPYHGHAGVICGNRDPKRHCTATRTVGWKPTCECNAGDPVPCLVLDNFNGVATSGVAAASLGRRYVGVDLKSDYLAMGHRRIADSLRPRSKLDPKPVKAAAGQLGLFD